MKVKAVGFFRLAVCGSATRVRLRLLPHPSGVYGDAVDGSANFDVCFFVTAAKVSCVRSSARRGLDQVL
jgi:hypothetical protein